MNEAISTSAENFFTVAPSAFAQGLRRDVSWRVPARPAGISSLAG
jgi:hypothetical protein